MTKPTNATANIPNEAGPGTETGFDTEILFTISFDLTELSLTLNTPRV